MTGRVSLANQLRAIRVFNDWELVKRFGAPGRDVYCSYSVNGGRTVMPPKSAVICPGHNTDPGGPWYNHGHKVFTGKRAESLPAAVAWASEQFGVVAWSPSPFGGSSSRIPSEVLERAREFLANPPAAVPVPEGR